MVIVEGNVEEIEQPITYYYPIFTPLIMQDREALLIRQAKSNFPSAGQYVICS